MLELFSIFAPDFLKATYLWKKTKTKNFTQLSTGKTGN